MFENFNQEKTPTGVERVYKEAKEEIITFLSLPVQEVQQLLDDPDFMSKATKDWAEILSKSENPEETEEKLKRGLMIRIKEEIKIRKEETK